MVHLYSAHTLIEDIVASYSIERLKSELDYLTRDYETLNKLKNAVLCRLGELDKLEFFEAVKITQSTDYSHGSRIVFYVAKELYARENGQEIYVSSTHNRRFFWKEKKNAFSYAHDLGKEYGIEIRDLTKKKVKEVIH